MTVSTLAAAMLLTSAPLNHAGVGTVVPVFLASPAATGQQAAVSDGPMPVAPVPAPTPPQSLKPADPTPPVHAPGADEHEIVVRARVHAPPGDPFEGANMKSFAITQDVDRAVIRPVALAYQRIVPDPLRSGFRNFLNNLREPVVFLNFLLQIKPGKAAETFGRFAINTTIGGAGLFDMAKRKPFKLARRRNGFGNTLGYYGVGPGPFFFLPIVGPTTLRDFFGDNLDRLVVPTIVGKPFDKPVYVISVGVLSSLDQRAEFDEKLQVLHEGSADPYASTREDYLRSRQAAIDELHHHKHRDTPPPLMERTLPGIR